MNGTLLGPYLFAASIGFLIAGPTGVAVGLITTGVLSAALTVFANS